MSSRVALGLMCVAIAVAAYLGARAVHTESPHASDDVNPRSRVVPEAESTPSTHPGLRTSGDSRGADTEAPTNAGGAESPSEPLRVRVIEDATGSPVEGAQVSLAWATSTDLLAGALQADSSATTEATDGSGYARLALPHRPAVGDSVLVALATAEERLPASAVVPFGKQEAVLRLSRGSVLRGRVVDGRGQPVPALDLEIRHAALGLPEVGEATVRPLRGRAIRRVRSGADGRFALSGLPDGAYDVWPRTPGWTVAFHRPFPRLRTGREERTVAVYPVRTFRARLVDAKSGESLTSLVRTAHVLFNKQSEIESADGSVEPTRIATAAGWQRVGSSKPVDGVISGVAWWRGDPGKVPTTARLLLQADGFDTVTAAIRLMTPEAFASSAAVDLVKMPRTFQGEIERVVVACTWKLADGLRAGSQSKLILQEPRMVIHGARESESSWVFRGVPVGRHEQAWLSDGIGLSAPFALSVPSTDGAGGRAVFERTSGLRVDVRDPAGLGVFRVEDVLVEGTTIDGERFTTRMPGAALDGPTPGGGRGGLSAWPVPPGEYTVAVQKSGYRSPTCTVVVETGRVAVCRVDLTPSHAKGK